MSNKSRTYGRNPWLVQKRSIDVAFAKVERRPFFTRIASHHGHATRNNLTLGVIIGKLPRRSK